LKIYSIQVGIWVKDKVSYIYVDVKAENIKEAIKKAKEQVQLDFNPFTEE
jgi:hypothetical protein